MIRPRPAILAWAAALAVCLALPCPAAKYLAPGTPEASPPKALAPLSPAAGLVGAGLEAGLVQVEPALGAAPDPSRFPAAASAEDLGQAPLPGAAPYETAALAAQPGARELVPGPEGAKLGGAGPAVSPPVSEPGESNAEEEALRPTAEELSRHHLIRSSRKIASAGSIDLEAAARGGSETFDGADVGGEFHGPGAVFAPPAELRFTRYFLEAAGKIPGMRGNPDSGPEGRLWHRLRLDIAALLDEHPIDRASPSSRGDARDAGIWRFKWIDGSRRRIAPKRQRYRRRYETDPDDRPDGIRVLFHWDRLANVLTFLDVRYKSDILTYRDNFFIGQNGYYDRMALRAVFRERFLINSRKAQILGKWLLEDPSP